MPKKKDQEKMKVSGVVRLDTEGSVSKAGRTSYAIMQCILAQYAINMQGGRKKK